LKKESDLTLLASELGLTLLEAGLALIPVVGPALAFGTDVISLVRDIEGLQDRAIMGAAAATPEGLLGVKAEAGEYLAVAAGALSVGVDLPVPTLSPRSAALGSVVPNEMPGRALATPYLDAASAPTPSSMEAARTHTKPTAAAETNEPPVGIVQATEPNAEGGAAHPGNETAIPAPLLQPSAAAPESAAGFPGERTTVPEERVVTSPAPTAPVLEPTAAPPAHAHPAAREPDLEASV